MKWILTFAVLAIIIIAGLYYNDWHNKEYPSGKLTQSTNKITIFYGGWYCDKLFISIEDTFQVGEYVVESDVKINEVEGLFIFILDNYGVDYNIFYKEWCEGKKEVEFNLNETVVFVVSYHTYDRLLFGNEPAYIKTKVFESVYIT